MSFVAASLVSQRSARLSVLERLVYDESAALRALADLQAGGLAREAVLLSTCHRVELYTVLEGPSDAGGIGRFLAADRGVEWSVVSPVLSNVEGAEAVRHLFRVASGLDSLVVGERQIYLQVRAAYLLAKQAGTVGPELDGLLRWALNVGRRVRRETGLGSLSWSMGRAAVEAAARSCGGLSGRTVLLLGAGKMARDVVDRLHEERADVLVCSRGEERASRLAGDPKRVLPLDRLRWGLARADVVICCAATRERLIRPFDIAMSTRRRERRSLTIVDLSIPRNADPAVGQLPGVRVIDLEVLAACGASQEGEGEEAATAQSETFAATETDRYLAWAAARRVGPLIAALRRSAETSGPEFVHRVTVRARQAAATGDEGALEDLCVRFGVSRSRFDALKAGGIGSMRRD